MANMNETENPKPVETAPPGALDSLLARLKEAGRKKGKTKGAFGKQTLAQKMAKARFNDPVRVARREARNAVRKEAREKRLEKN